MQFLIRMRLFDSIIGEADIQRARKAFVKQLGTIMDSGALLTSGAFAGQRGGFLLVEVDSGEQLWELLGEGVLDHFDVKTDAVFPLENLKEFLEKPGARRK